MDNNFNKKIAAVIIHGISQVPTNNIDEDLKKTEMMINLSKMIEENKYEFIMQQIRNLERKEHGIVLKRIL